LAGRNRAGRGCWRRGRGQRGRHRRRPVNSGVSEEEAEVYAEAVRRGSTLISVKVSDSDIVAVERELAKSDYVNVSERRADYLARGWKRFDVGARPYTPEEIAAERERRFERT
jgi:hypothetical protein